EPGQQPFTTRGERAAIDDEPSAVRAGAQDHLTCRTILGVAPQQVLVALRPGSCLAPRGRVTARHDAGRGWQATGERCGDTLSCLFRGFGQAVPVRYYDGSGAARSAFRFAVARRSLSGEDEHAGSLAVHHVQGPWRSADPAPANRPR